MCLHSEGQGQFFKARKGERARSKKGEFFVLKNSAALDMGWEAAGDQGS